MLLQLSLQCSHYFQLLLELIDSIKKYKESENVSICVLDAGLTEQQKENLREDKKIISQGFKRVFLKLLLIVCLLYTSPSPRD